MIRQLCPTCHQQNTLSTVESLKLNIPRFPFTPHLTTTKNRKKNRRISETPNSHESPASPAQVAERAKRRQVGRLAGYQGRCRYQRPFLVALLKLAHVIRVRGPRFSLLTQQPSLVAIGGHSQPSWRYTRNEYPEGAVWSPGLWSSDRGARAKCLSPPLHTHACTCTLTNSPSNRTS